MEITTMWWLLMGIAVGLELLTGTFYLLMLALGLAAGAIAAHMGLNSGWQYLTAAMVGSGAVLYWYLRQRTGQTLNHADTQSNHNVHLDIGSTVEVAAWSPTGTAQVVYRGAQWAARHQTSGLQALGVYSSGWHRITAVEGNTLVLVEI
jgi:membrane protein implicated in regulation of membrane protease activity